MDKNLTFSKATIEGTSSPFYAGYLQANNLIVQTTSASIKGTFHANESLTLDTVDAYVFVLMYTAVADYLPPTQSNRCHDNAEE